MQIRLFALNAIRKVCLLMLYMTFAFCQTPENDIDDHAVIGNYLIVYCNANSTGSHAAYLQLLIPYMQSHLQAVLTDLDRGTASPAYRTFFKTNKYLDSVRQVFTDMVNGSAVPYSTGGPQNITRWSPPVLVCADADQPFLHHLLDDCDVPPPAVIYVSHPAKFFAVCPIFWKLPRIARRAACPRVLDGRLLAEPWKPRTTQFAVLVHELAHVYNRFDSREEVYDWSDVVGLSAERSLENAQNFALYASGKSTWVCFRLRCGV